MIGKNPAKFYQKSLSVLKNFFNKIFFKKRWRELLKSREISKPQKLRLLFISIILGIWLGQFPFWPNYLLLGGFLSLILAFAKRNFWLGIFAGFLVANSYAQWRNFVDFEKDQLVDFIGEEVEIRGKVVSFPDVREKNTRFYVEAETLKKIDINSFNSPPDKEERACVGKFLLITKNNSKNPAKLDYGDKILVRGKLILPTSFTADFDYRRYLKRFGVQTIIKNPAKLEILSQNQGNWFLQKAKNSRDFLEKNLEKSLPNPHAKIAMGVLLGVKNQLPKWTQTDFQTSGLTHLLVVSGTNVAIVIIAISFLLRKFGRKISFAGSLLALIFFVLMTGADAPILRAALMGGVAGWAISAGKMNDTRNLVLLSAVIIGIFQPLVLQSDIGFALSFGATLGIIIFFPMFEKKIREIFKLPSPDSKQNKNTVNSPLIRGARGVASILAISLSAQIAILPILMSSFGYFPLGGIPANLFSEPLMPFIMFFSFISSLAGILPIFLAKIITIPAYILLEFLLQIAHFFAQIPVIKIPLLLNQIFAGFIIFVLLYGLFSRDFAERFLVIVIEKKP